MEATGGWGWLSEVLQDLGLEVKLANPSKVKIIAESQIKTDKVDALALAQLLRTNFLPESYLAPKEQREARDLLRYRISLVHLRSGVKNRVHALPRRASVCLLTRLGIYHNYSDLFGKRGRIFHLHWSYLRFTPPVAGLRLRWLIIFWLLFIILVHTYPQREKRVLF